MHKAGQASSSNPDKPVARLEVWLARLAVVATGAALLATSPAPEYAYTFFKAVTGPRIELTASAPRARFLVTARARSLAPNQKPATSRASATVEGQIVQSGAAKFVTARVSKGNGSSSSELTVLTDFRMAQDLAFSGDCETPGEGTPCEARFELELERADAGETGGSVMVTWSRELEAQAKKDKGPDEGPLDLPWDGEISQL
jgi:hypothetical protein